MTKTYLRTSLIGLSVVLGSQGAAAGWAQDALIKQYNLQKHTPLIHSNIIGTHNSYSSNAYNMRLYENQNISITDQLNEGARFLELDLWRNTSLEYVSTILCHNGGRCGITTEDFIYTDTALREIANWAKNNRDQVVVIKLEDQMDDASYHYFVEAVQRTMGDIVYRPERGADGDGRISFPQDLSAADMLAKGKQIIFQGYSGASGNAIGRGWIFGTANSERDGGDVVDNRSALLNCSDHSSSRYALFYDSAAEDDFMSDKFVPVDMIQPLMECGGTVFGFDWLAQDDSRTHAAIWSWAPNEPNNARDENCAVSDNGRFNDVQCSQSYVYLCRNSDQWKLSTGHGEWQQGTNICRTEFGEAFAFDVPRTAKENKAVRELMSAKGIAQVWLNYSDQQQEGIWLTGEDQTVAVANNLQASLKVASWNKYQWIYDDAGTGGDNNIVIWRSHDLPAGWYPLGDTVGLATSGSKASYYGRKPGSSIVAFDDGSGTLAKPLSYEWRWNDWKTGGDHDVTFWSPVAPQGYTCLGDIAIASQSRSQPSTDMIRCVRNELLSDGTSLWEWSDSGSGGAYDATIYLTTTKVGAEVNLGLSANTFDVNVTNSAKVLDLRKVDWIAGPQVVIDEALQPLMPPEYRELKVMNMCVENGASGDNGRDIFVWGCHGGAWQKWVYEMTTGFIRNQHNWNMCLDSRGQTEAQGVVGQWQCEDHINLKWDWQGQTLRPRVAPGLALDLKWGDASNGQVLWLWPADGGQAQTFSWGNQ